jgi:hypothetical protein
MCAVGGPQLLPTLQQRGWRDSCGLCSTTASSAAPVAIASSAARHLLLLGAGAGCQAKVGDRSITKLFVERVRLFVLLVYAVSCTDLRRGDLRCCFSAVCCCLLLLPAAHWLIGMNLYIRKGAEFLVSYN